MLEAIGAGSIEELFEQIPAEVRLAASSTFRRPAEYEVYGHLAELAARKR